jgi:hypothetical protein
VKLIYYPTEVMIADTFTKPLARDKYWSLLRMMGLQSMEESKGTKIEVR